MANALISKFTSMLFKSDENKISAEGAKILLKNKWSKLSTIQLSYFKIMQVTIKLAMLVFVC